MRLKLFTATALAAAALAGCGGGDNKTRTVLGPAGQAALSPTPSAAPVTPAPQTPTPTPGRKKKKHPQGRATPTAVSSPGAAVTAAPTVVVPQTTRSPDLVQVKVVITTNAITLDRSTLPAGQGMMFNIYGKDVGDRGEATFTNGGAPIGISRIIPDGTHMETKSLVGRKLVITIRGSSKIKARRKVIAIR